MKITKNCNLSATIFIEKILKISATTLFLELLNLAFE